MTNWVEVIGHAGSIVVAVSLSLKNIKHLRIYNGIGALIFSIYGYFIGSYPVMLLNAYIVIMDAYYLYIMRPSGEFFTLTQNLSLTEDYLKEFIQFHINDIHQFFPDFHLEKIEKANAILIHRNFSPVGLFVYTLEKGEIHIHLDYALAEFRDYKNTTFLMNKMRDHFLWLGVKAYKAQSINPVHIRFLKKQGFYLKDGTYYKEI